MEIGVDFKNLSSYNENMAKGMEDKLWFLKHLNKRDNYLFVDFGCADGTLINCLSQFPVLYSSTFIGYDISDKMIDLAKTKFAWNPTIDIHFTTNWEDVKNCINDTSEEIKKVLILSSVIHEVYSYGSDEDVKLFWNRVFETGFDYIFIRDMMVSDDINRESSNSDVEKIYYRTKTNQLLEFIHNFGPINIQKNLVHFLLKYRWKINWDREVKENYFPISVEDFLSKFTNKYNLNNFERFRVPYLDKCIKEDFEITLDDYTHIKAFFEIKKK